MHDQITPVVLAYNEEANIGRTLDALRWAPEVLVVDSLSDDRTLEIVGGYANARVLSRPFDDFASQWNHAMADGGIHTPWVLALDADYVLTPELVAELGGLSPDAETTAFLAHFRYCIHGSPLRGSLYPSSTILFRHAGARFRQDGHAYRIDPAPGRTGELQHRVLHDDRKPLSRWLSSQAKYAGQEAEKLLHAEFATLSWADRIRLAPFLSTPTVVLYCLLAKGCALDGRAGLTYTAQRATAESILSWHLLRARLGGKGAAKR